MIYDYICVSINISKTGGVKAGRKMKLAISRVFLVGHSYGLDADAYF